MSKLGFLVAMAFATAYLSLLWIGALVALGRWHGGTGWLGPVVIALFMGWVVSLALRDWDRLSKGGESDTTAPAGKGRTNWKRYLVRLGPRALIMTLSMVGAQELGGAKVVPFWITVFAVIPFVAVTDGIWYVGERGWKSVRSRSMRSA